MTLEPERTLAPLYPYLFDGNPPTSAPDSALLTSIAEKCHEIADLRAAVLHRQLSALERAAMAASTRLLDGGRLFTFGNGGSSTDAEALATLFAEPPAGARAFAAAPLCSDVATVTALANDVGFDVTVTRQLAVLGNPGDVAVALSTSGGSTNVLRGLEQARRLGMLTIGFAGYDGGAMAESGYVDHLIVIGSTSVHRIQEAQTTAFHVLWELVQDAVSTP